MVRPAFKVEWVAHEYEHKERSPDWFWAVGIVSVAIAIASSLFGNIIFGILVVVAVFSLAIFANRPPSDVLVSISEKGISSGKTLYPFETLKSFWVDVEHPHKKVILRSQKVLMPLIVIPLGEETDPERVRRLLSKFLPEEYQSLPLVERLLEYLGF